MVRGMYVVRPWRRKRRLEGNVGRGRMRDGDESGKKAWIGCQRYICVMRYE
jgi:hypothetical protein